MNTHTRNPIILAGLGLLLMIVGTALSSPGPVGASDWVKGDIFAGVGNGSYQVYDNSGVYKETISCGTSQCPQGEQGLTPFMADCSFNNTSDKLYTTDFTNSHVIVYADTHPHVVLQNIDTNPGEQAESVVFATNGDFYVGHAGGLRLLPPNNAPDVRSLLHRYNAAGVLQQPYQVPIECRGSDWVDLATDQRTIFYTSEGGRIFKYDLATSTPLADLTSALPVGGSCTAPAAYELKLLPPKDGSGGLLLADTFDIKRLDGAGNVVMTYTAPGENSWFAMSLDPNGTSFWAATQPMRNTIYRFNLATGAIEVGPIYTETRSTTPPPAGAALTTALFGLCIKELPSPPLPPTTSGTERMTGGGSVFTQNRTRVTHGFELHCDPSQLPNSLEINWGSGNQFHMETLVNAFCFFDQAVGSPRPPVADFNTYIGTGTGRYNGAPGATVNWTFTDAGEPGTKDSATIVITDAGANVVLSVSGKLTKGNQQAHK